VIVLILHATKHGATAEIAQEVAKVLAEAGLEVQEATYEDAPALDGFDAFVLGSGIYYGHWLAEATRFIEKHQQALQSRPSWVFASGPLGDPPQPQNDEVAFAPLLQLLDVRGRATFAGKLDREDLSFTERIVARVVKAPEGDFRPWSDIRAWAAGIAAELQVRSPA
jgi:menaquinone-dependent protoporphyrinogen oxidase